MARLPIETKIERPADHDIMARDAGLVWKVSFTKRFDEKSASSSVELLSQGELIKLWQQIGVLFNLADMREGLTDEDIEQMGVFRK